MKKQAPPSFMEKMGRFIQPWALFVGVALGFVGLVLAGRWADKRDIYAGVPRFHPLISTDGSVYPTLGHLQQHVRANASRRKILVLVGGNSILLGVGQPVESLWTKDLQKQLGKEFRVVNLAFRGAEPVEMGAIVAETLREEYPRMIYIANGRVDSFTTPVGNPNFYGYLYWQARAAGQLLDDAHRESVALDSLNHPDEKTRQQFSEIFMRGFVDARLHTSSFWNWVGQEALFTVWNVLVNPPQDFWKPRKLFKDFEPDPLSDPGRWQRTDLEREAAIVRGESERTFKDTPEGGFIPDPLEWTFRENTARSCFPPEVLPRTLYVLSHNAPAIVKRLSERDQERYRAQYSMGRERLARVFSVIVFGENLESDDYFSDRTHFTRLAAPLMAKEVAAKVREMSISLGYLPK